jgi:hypothetical protein
MGGGSLCIAFELLRRTLALKPVGANQLADPLLHITHGLVG